jgi:hypothetical protein
VSIKKGAGVLRQVMYTSNPCTRLLTNVGTLPYRAGNRSPGYHTVVIAYAVAHREFMQEKVTCHPRARASTSCSLTLLRELY